MTRLLFVILALFFLFNPVDVKAQKLSPERLKEVKKKSRRVRKKFRLDVPMLAMKLTEPWEDEESKVFALQYWIAHNIKYRYSDFLDRKATGYSIDRVLRNRRALCGEYARLYQLLCAEIGVKAEVVAGYTKDFDFFSTDTLYRAEHAWTVVNIEGRWELHDITWGSGMSVPKKQYIRKFLAYAFRIPYNSKWKYKQIYNPDWFYVAPSQMIYTHAPAANIFQLISPPVPVDSFQVGGSAIYSHLRNGVTEGGTGELDMFSSYGEIRKLKFMAEQSQQNHPANHRYKGFNNYLIADSLFRPKFVDSLNLLVATEEQMVEMEKHLAVSDSFLMMSIADNGVEYQTYQERNANWMKKAKQYNKHCTDSLKQRIKRNKKQYKLVKKIKRKNKRALQTTARLRKRYRRNKISKCRRPTKEKKEKPEVHESLMASSETLQTPLLKHLQQKDSLLSTITVRDKFVSDSTEVDNARIQHELKAGVKGWVKFRTMFFYMTYNEGANLRKDWFADQLAYADSVNMVCTDSLLQGEYRNQEAALKEMKDYYKRTGEKLKAYCKAKKCVMGDRGEEDAYHEGKALYMKEMAQARDQFRSYFSAQRRLARKLKSEVKIMNKAKRKFKADDRLERLRYRNYDKHRKNIKRAENARMKLVLSINQRRRKQIAKARSKRPQIAEI